MTPDHGNLLLGFIGLAIVILSSVVAMAWWASHTQAKTDGHGKLLSAHRRSTDSRFARQSDLIREVQQRVTNLETDKAVRDALEEAEGGQDSVKFKPPESA